MKEKQKSILNPEEIPARFAEAWNNREDIRKAHDYGLRVIFRDSDLKVTKTTVKYLSDDIAVVHARMKLKGQTPVDDKSPGFRFTIFTFVVHKSEYGWSCATAQNTDIAPGKETNLLDGGDLKAVDYRE